MEQVSATRCRVRLSAPNGRRFSFDPIEVGQGLLSVEVSKDLHQAVGSFTLTFDGRLDSEGRRWDERIPRRSLVLIRLERPGSDVGEDATTVMIGLTDVHSVQESYARAAPARHVTLAGREISCVILDAMLYFDPYLAANPQAGTITTQSEQYGPVKLSLIAHPALVGSGLDPKDALRTILDYFLFVGGTVPEALGGPGAEGTPLPQHPLIALDLPDTPLRAVLDPNYDAWTTFAPVRVPLSQFPATVGSLWNYLHLYIDRTFQEFFTRIEEGQCKIHFRGKPFMHDPVQSGTRFKATTDEPTLQTLELDPADILSLHLARDTTQVYNLFKVIPRGMSNSHKTANWRYRIQPQVVDEADHPSFVGRYGVRPMEVQSMYLSPFDPVPGAGTGVPTSAGATRAPGTGMPTPATARPLKPSPAAAQTYAALADQIAEQQGIPAELRPWFVASIERESSWDPTAKGTSGEKGLGQLMPGTIAQVGGINDPFDPVQSLTGAAKYWNYLRAQPNIGNDPQLILAGYNAGPSNVRGGTVPASAETHVRAVTALVPRYQGMAGTAPAAPPAAAPTAAGAAPPQDDAATMPMIERANTWAAILRAWYDMGGELLSGTVVVRGHPQWNVGHRLLCAGDTRGAWEAYIEGVRHTYDVHTGQYLTILRLTRGWYLSSAWSVQLIQEGQTTITDATGGPSTLDPATGAPVEAPQAGEGDVEVIIHGAP